MSRNIWIGYQPPADESDTPIEVRPPYFILGTQATSTRFWGLPQLREIGLARLTKLGETDPISFVGWEELADLRQEIHLLQRHADKVPFDEELKAQWVAHLVYCFLLLVQTAPKDAVPVFSVG